MDLGGLRILEHVPLICVFFTFDMRFFYVRLLCGRFGARTKHPPTQRLVRRAGLLAAYLLFCDGICNDVLVMRCLYISLR